MLKISNIYQVFHPQKPLFLIGLIGLWLIYVLFYVLLKLHSGISFYAGILEFICGFIINFFEILLTFLLWKRTKGKNRVIFALFLISFIAVIVNNVSYNITTNILGITHFSNLVDSVFDIPFLGFLIFQILVWFIIFLSAKPTRNNRIIFFSYLPVVTTALVIFCIFAFSVEWKIHAFTLIGFYISVDTVLQIIGFIFAFLCLCMATKRQIYYISIGYLIIITSCFMVHYKVLSQTLTTNLLIEPIWSLGALLMMFGFYELWLKERQGIELNDWLSNINGVRAQCAFWSFLLCAVSLIAFWLVSYMFIGNILFQISWLQHMLPILIIFSALSILISLIFAKILSAPFGRLESVINFFMQDKNVELPPRTCNSNIDEFQHLENFLTKAFEVLKEKNKAQQILANCTSQVAHDVRKPFTILKLMLQLVPILTPEQTKKYSEDLDISIRKVESLLSDIMEVSREKKYELTPGNILSALDISIKYVSRCYPNKNINFYYQLDTVPLISMDEQRICRAFENIIDNAFSFLPKDNGFMWFSVKEKHSFSEIVIGNSHSHIPEEEIKKIFQDKFTSGKKGGTGLGLSIVTKVLDGHKGTILARNVSEAPSFVPENARNIKGVEFVVTLPLTDNPGYDLKDPVLKNSGEAKAVFGMAQKENILAGSSQIDALKEKLKALPSKPNLLILDDESIYRVKVRSVLENLGDLNNFIHTYDAANYKEAIALLDHAKIDYLICDIDLSDKEETGFSVLSYAKQKYSDCQVLMHTNRKDPEDINKAKELGACGFCPKPITEAILVDLLLEKKLWPTKKEHNNVPKKVLLLNDEEVINESIKILLKNSFYTVEAFTTVEGALSFYSQNELYAILSDIHLGDDQFNGYYFLKEIRAKNKNIPFIFASGSSRGDEWPKAKEAGATEYIQLPLSKDNLLNMLNSLQ